MTVSTTLANNPAPIGATSGSGLSIGGLFTLTGVEDTLTAHAGGTKAAALALSATKNFHRVSVCATEGDSVLLPAATVGQSHFVRNDGAAPMKVYGAGTDTINGIATATGVQQSHASGALYECLTAGEWRTTGLIEAGTWVPVFTSTTGTDGSLAYTSSGKYTKIGRLIHVEGQVNLSDLGSRTGRVEISGIPATAVSGFYVFSAAVQNAAFGGYASAEIGNVSLTRVAFPLSNTGGAMTYLGIADCAATTSLFWSGSYVAAA